MAHYEARVYNTLPFRELSKDIFRKHVSENKKPTDTKLMFKWHGDPKGELELNVKYKIAQPFGSQRTPDIIILYKDDDNALHITSIEVKSSKSFNIFWNDGAPMRNCMYVVFIKGDLYRTFKRGDLVSEKFYTARNRILTDIRRYKHIDNDPDKNHMTFELFPRLNMTSKVNKYSFESYNGSKMLKDIISNIR